MVLRMATSVRVFLFFFFSSLAVMVLLCGAEWCNANGWAVVVSLVCKPVIEFFFFLWLVCMKKIVLF